MSWTHPESTERKLRTSDALAIQLPSSSHKDNNPCIIDGNIDKLKNLYDDLGHGPLFSIGFFDWKSIKLSEFTH